MAILVLGEGGEEAIRNERAGERSGCAMGRGNGLLEAVIRES